MKKLLYSSLGFIFLALAILGVILPGIPTTPFLIVAAACFAKSSPKLHNWLLNNPLFAPILKNWQATRSIPRKTKVISLITIIIVGTISIFSLKQTYLQLLVILVLIFPIIFILRIRETETVSKKDQ